MKKYYRLLSVLILLLNAFPSQGQNNRGEVVIAKQDSLYSAVFEEHRKLFVHIPSEFNIGHFRLHPIKYPVVYVLDPEAHFPSVVSMIDRMSYEELCPQMINIPST